MSHCDHSFEPGFAQIAVEQTVLSRLEGLLPISCSKVGALLAASDFALIITLDSIVRSFFKPITTSQFNASFNSAFVCGLSAVLYCLFMEAQDQYASTKWRVGPRNSLRPVVSWIAAFVTLSSLVFFAKVGAEVSRASVMYVFCTGLVMLPAWRFGSLRLFAFMQDQHMFAVCDRVVVVSVADDAGLDPRHANQLRRQGKAIAARMIVDAVDHTAIAQLKSLLSSQRIDQIWFSCPTDTAMLSATADALKVFPLPVFWLADHTFHKLHALPVDDFGPVKALRVQGGPLTKSQQNVKRALDIVLASAGLMLLSPLLVLVAMVIKFDSRGPVVFSQRRSGFNGRTFKIYKFRSMTTMDDGAQIVQATRDDQRITKVGRVMRRTSIDELPQLINVIKGDMSLVGPRPHALSHDTQYSQLIETYALRYHVKPGITGWAQVKGCRGETKTLADMERRVDLDLWYIKNWSFWTDVKAILGTMKQLVGSANAY